MTRVSRKIATPLRPTRGQKPRRKASWLRKMPERVPCYLAFLRRQPCCVCLREGPGYAAAGISGGLYEGAVQVSATEAAHFGPRGLSQKASDLDALPLCGAEHHREGPFSAHKLGKQFAAFHGLDLAAIQAALRGRFEQERAA